MKTLNMLLVLLFFSFNLKAQCLSNKAAFESYYEQNISTLDQIEGFWSVTFYYKVYINNILVDSDSRQQTAEWAIVKDGPVFVACDINGNNPTKSTLEFTPTVNPNVYLYKKTYLDEITKVNAIIKSVGILEYSYEVGEKELKDRNIYETGMRRFLEFSWIKTYPTKETIQKNQKSYGTGFAISTDGLIVTCNHVINNSQKIKVRGINNDFSKTFEAKIVSTDKNNDIAIVQIDDPNFTSIENIPYVLANKSIEVGSSVFALGYPLRSSMGDEIKLTDGIISAKSGFKGDMTSYQISVPVQPGNSGGPLFDDEGNIVGIVNAKHHQAENAAYAIKISYLNNLLESLSLNSNLATKNTLSAMSLPEKVKVLRNFTYIIECN